MFFSGGEAGFCLSLLAALISHTLDWNLWVVIVLEVNVSLRFSSSIVRIIFNHHFKRNVQELVCLCD